MISLEGPRLTDSLQCVRFITGLSTFQIQNQTKSHRSQQKGYNMLIAELQKLLNDLLTDSPHMGRAMIVPTPAGTQEATASTRNARSTPMTFV
jgi:hypothetical protein